MGFDDGVFVVASLDGSFDEGALVGLMDGVEVGVTTVGLGFAVKVM